jgi:hypothetical protein
MEFLRNSWFLIVFVGGLIYWAAHQESSLAYVQKDEARITALEKRTNILENGIAQMQMKIDGIKEDVSLIKGAVIKK